MSTIKEGFKKLPVDLKDSCTLLIVSHGRDQVRRIAGAVFEPPEGKFVPMPVPADRDIQSSP